MAREMCPSCREIRNLRASVSARTVTGSHGEKKRIKTIAFHCEQCHQFVRSEEHEEIAEE